MANPEQLAVLKEGVPKWNEWRKHSPDVRPSATRATTIARWRTVEPAAGDFLYVVHLNEAHLAGASLMGVDFRESDLSGANLQGADLRGARMISANLQRADLRNADLRGAQLLGTVFHQTVLGGTNLNGAKGLELCFHRGPSTVDLRTLELSSDMPLTFQGPYLL